MYIPLEEKIWLPGAGSCIAGEDRGGRVRRRGDEAPPATGSASGKNWERKREREREREEGGAKLTVLLMMI